MTQMHGLKTFAAAAIVAIAASGSAMAATCGSGGNAVTYTLSQAGTQIVGVCGSGNDSAVDVNSLAPSASGSWLLADKTDNNDPTPLASFLLPLPGPNQTSWSVSNTSNYPALLLVLKQSNNYAAFVLDVSKALSGVWGTVKGNSVNDLSHASLYVAGTPAPAPGPGPGPSPVPLPAAGLLLVAGLGGLAALRRRSARA
jgi:hypothetical protein